MTASSPPTTTAPPTEDREAARARVRRSRERSRAGIVRVVLNLQPDGITSLIGRGYLAADRRTDRRSVQEAFSRFVDAALASPWRKQ